MEMLEYPLFNSIVNRIQKNLQERDIKTTSFRTWDESKINASGLEIVIDLADASEYINALLINFDWDRFRETVLARQLEGMEKHPLLHEDNRVKTNIDPIIDIEVIWEFDNEKTQDFAPKKIGEHRIETASQWMESINERVNELLRADDIITRWHLEVEGDKYGRYLSAINLISYFQFSLAGLNDLDSVHQFLERKIQHLLYKTNKVIKIADKTIASQAA